VGSLKEAGFTIIRVCDTATREPGKDIVAQDSAGRRLWVTVKGFPVKSRDQQARHWFAGVVYDLVRYRTEDGQVLLGAGLPALRIYRTLSSRIEWLKRRLPFSFYWVHEDGKIEIE
jgi:hypothetical protein